MAKMRRVDSKSALRQQQAAIRRGARGKAHIGDDTGSAAGKAAERAKVLRMQAEYRARQEHEAHREEPIAELVAELVSDTLALARTVVSAPFRIASALRRPVHAA